MQGQCAGYRSFTGKNNVTWYVYGFLVPYGPNERRQGACEGMQVKEFWSNVNFGVQPGQPYDLLFDPGYNGRAELSAVLPRKKEDKVS